MTPKSDPVEAIRERIVAAVIEQYRAAWRKLHETAWPQVRAAVGAAAAEHRRIVDALGSTDVPPVGTEPDASVAEAPPARDRRFDGTYREEVARRVLTPLVEALSRIAPGEVPVDLIEETEHDADNACGRLAASAPLPWMDESLRPRPGDALTRRIDKFLLRASRRLRPKRERGPVPESAVARHVLNEECVYPQRRAFAEAQRSWAAALAGVERAWAEWGDTLLRLPALEDEEDVRERAGSAEVVQRLQGALEAVAAATPHEMALDRGLADLDRVDELLSLELPLAGTLAFRPNPGPLPPRRERDPGPGPSWSQWCAQSVERLDLLRALLDVMIGCDAVVGRARTQLRASYADDLAAGCHESQAGIRALRGDLDRASATELRGRLRAVRGQAEELIGRALEVLPTHEAFERAVRTTADSMTEALHALTRQVPMSVTLHPLPAADEAPRRPRERRMIRLQEAARQAFDVLRMERVRTLPLALVERVAPVLGDRDRFGEVVGFGCESAEAELDEGGDDAEVQARTLVGEGLERAADAIEVLPGALDGELAHTWDELQAEVRAGWGRLVERALAQGMQGRYMDVRSRISESFQDLRDRLAPWARDGSRRVRLAFAVLRRAVARLLRRGRSLVGTHEASRQVAYSTTRMLADPGRLLEGLPLVYQRLFSFGAISDPGLLAGRDVDLAEVEMRWQRWREDEGIPLVVVGRPGAGVSSFFLIAVQRLEALGARTAHTTLDRRYTDEADLARALAALLDLDPVDSLEALASSVLAAPPDAMPDLVAVEGVEHLYLRLPGGTDLIERLLTLTAETEPRLFWMLSVTQSAWQLVQKAEPSAVSQIDRITLAPLDAVGIRNAILTRHRRSGVPLSYVEPTEGRRLLRRRLRRLQGTAGQQKVLEDDFFERLHRSSGGNVRFALFEWLRAADFSSRRGELRVRPLEPMDFSFLEALDLTQNFTLKALLEHRTLSLEEHDRIFRLPRQESYQIFESLRNRNLIEAVTDDATDGVVGVKGEGRYRLVPLLTGAVAAHLARRNILH